jgi:hypothetical protein
MWYVNTSHNLEIVFYMILYKKKIENSKPYAQPCSFQFGECDRGLGLDCATVLGVDLCQ